MAEKKPFRVYLKRTVEQRALVTVQAEDAEAACETAVSRQDVGNFITVDDTINGNVADVEEVF
jgi:ActR/RegA family two-component response regulator